MTLVDNTACAECGAALDIDAGVTPSVTFAGRGGRPNVRVLVVAGKEIHRCESLPNGMGPNGTGPDQRRPGAA